MTSRPERESVPAGEAGAVVAAYSAAQIQGLRAGILAAGVIALGSIPFTRRLPAGLVPARPAAAVPGRAD